MLYVKMVVIKSNRCSQWLLSTSVFSGQIAFIKELMAEGLDNTTDVVFLDMDAFVVDSIAEVFH